MPSPSRPAAARPPAPCRCCRRDRRSGRLPRACAPDACSGASLGSRPAPPWSLPVLCWTNHLPSVSPPPSRARGRRVPAAWHLSLPYRTSEPHHIADHLGDRLVVLRRHLVIDL